MGSKVPEPTYAAVTRGTGRRVKHLVVNKSCQDSWPDYGEGVYCASREMAERVADALNAGGGRVSDEDRERLTDLRLVAMKQLTNWLIVLEAGGEPNPRLKSLVAKAMDAISWADNLLARVTPPEAAEAGPQRGSSSHNTGLVRLTDDDHKLLRDMVNEAEIDAQWARDREGSRFPNPHEVGETGYLARAALLRRLLGE